MKRLAFIIAAAALLVSAPRLAVTFVMADGVVIPASIAAAVFAGTGVASGLVLTGGNVYIAHVLAAHWKRQGGLWLVLLVSWLLFLGFAVVLIAPLLTYGLSHSVLSSVLTTPGVRWAWAIAAALSVELLAAAAMAADVLRAEPTAATRITGAAKRAASGSQGAASESSSAASDSRGAASDSRGAASGKRSVKEALSERLVRALDADQRHAAPQPAVAGPQPAIAGPQPAVAEPQPAVVLAPLYACGNCARTFTSQPALAGHMRHCTPQEERSSNGNGNGNGHTASRL